MCIIPISIQMYVCRLTARLPTCRLVRIIFHLLLASGIVQTVIVIVMIIILLKTVEKRM